MRCFLTALLLCATAVWVEAQTGCPDLEPDLVPWNPTNNDTLDYVIDGEKLLLESNLLQFRSITIQNGGKLVVSDQVGAINIEVKHILIQSFGEFHAGSSTCRFQNNLDITLLGRTDDTDIPAHGAFGRKYIGIMKDATISIHGASKLSWTYLTTDLEDGRINPVITLADDVVNWVEGDQVVIASSDYDYTQTEVFDVDRCLTCGAREIRIIGPTQYAHSGTFTAQGVDTRAEVGILTRNIKIHGNMETGCYDNNYCQFFDYDTFGGHIQVLRDFAKAEFVGIELYNMGQQFLGRYPIHYHIVGAAYGAFVKELSIHNCFSRCVTVHATEGLTVQDVVGYDTLGHCFFLEDGNEVNNQLIHNLGLVTKPGTLLPSDRDQAMCEGLLDNVYPGYVPNAQEDCMEVATFWITHPNNTIRNNSAGGSVNNGFHYVFHREPTGPSAGTLPPFHGERSAIPMFLGNKAHSNIDAGLLLDRGVKINAATEQGPAEFLAMRDYAKYMPHVDRDPLKARSASHIVELTSYKNHQGAVVRGGDVYIQRSKFTDNDVGVIMLSNDFLPHDAGSHQELTESTIAATTDYNDAEWQGRSYPSVGVQLANGPSLVDQNHFYGYTSAGGREAYAIGFVPQFSGQFATSNTMGTNTADSVAQKVYFGRNDAASIHGSYDSDGDKFQMFWDRDGTLTGWVGGYAVRLDTPLMKGDNCYDQAPANGVVCTGNNYGQIFVNATTKTANMTIERLAEPYDSVMLQGANKDDTKRYPDTTQYQAAVVVNRDYHVYFSEPTPSWVQLSAYNFPFNDSAKIAVDYDVASADNFHVSYIEWKQMEDTVTRNDTLTAGSSIADVDNDTNGFTYFWDDVAKRLYVKLVNHYSRTEYEFCPSEGCQFIEIITS